MTLGQDVSDTEHDILRRFLSMKRIDFRWLSHEEISELRDLLWDLYDSQKLSTTEIARKLAKSQFATWSLFKRLGIPLRSREEGGRIYAPKRTPNARRPFSGSPQDRAYLRGFARGDLDVRRVSKLAIMVSSTTTHPAFVTLFKSLFEAHGPVYIYPIRDDKWRYKWKVAARLDNSFAFILPDQGDDYPHFHTKDEFLAWLAGLIDSDGSVGIIHSGRYLRVNLQIANEDIELLQHIKIELKAGGYHPDGPYRVHRQGHVTEAWNIVYNHDMYCLGIQRYSDVRKILPLLPLRHEEKRRRCELVLQLTQPLLWKVWQRDIRTLRNQIRMDVISCVHLAEENYKRRRESPTS
jgi:hypothetical protein